MWIIPEEKPRKKPALHNQANSSPHTLQPSWRRQQVYLMIPWHQNPKNHNLNNHNHKNLKTDMQYLIWDVSAMYSVHKKCWVSYASWRNVHLHTPQIILMLLDTLYITRTSSHISSAKAMGMVIITAEM
jgi:hypothetical protein